MRAQSPAKWGRNYWGYEWKINGSWAYFLVVGLYGLLAFSLLENWRHMGALRTLRAILQAFEVYLPLAASLLVAHLIPQEIEGGTAELLLSYRVPRLRILLGKIAVPLAVVIGMFLATFLATAPCRAAIVKATPGYRDMVSLTGLLLVSAPTAVILSGLAAFASILGRSTLAGLLSGTGLWMVDVMTGGTYLKWFTLFRQYHQCSCAEIGLVPNKILLTAAGLLFYLLAWRLLERPERLLK